MNNENTFDIHDLLEKVRGSDDAAFADLLSRYTPMINKIISGYYVPSVSHSEAFSEASVALLRAAETYDPSAGGVTFGLYAKICVYRRLSDFYQRAGRDIGVVDLDPDMIAVHGNAESRLVGIERMREYLAIAEKILSRYEYSVFLLYVDGYDTKTIADRLSKDIKSVENAKVRMFRHLREGASAFQDI